MKATEARKRIKTIRRHYLCSVCLIPRAFCRQHSHPEREYALTALRDIARRKTRKRKPKEQTK